MMLQTVTIITVHVYEGSGPCGFKQKIFLKFLSSPFELVTCKYVIDWNHLDNYQIGSYKDHSAKFGQNPGYGIRLGGGDLLSIIGEGQRTLDNVRIQ